MDVEIPSSSLRLVPLKLLGPIEPGEMIGVVYEVRDPLALGPAYRAGPLFRPRERPQLNR